MVFIMLGVGSEGGGREKRGGGGWLGVDFCVL